MTESKINGNERNKKVKEERIKRKENKLNGNGPGRGKGNKKKMKEKKVTEKRGKIRECMWERKGKERKGKERKGKERKGKESFSCRNLISCKAALQRLFCEKRYTNNLELTGKERKRKSKEVRKTRTRKGKGMEIGQAKILIMKQNII